MANSLNEDVTDKHVVIKGRGPDLERVVLVKDGFGRVPFTSGTALIVLCINGEEVRFSGYDIERLATVKEAEEFGRRVEKAISPKPEEETNKIKVQVLSGVEGHALIINNVRVAGPKAWGGGTVIHEWSVDPDRLKEAAK